MSAYNRLWTNINSGIQKRKTDCLHKESISKRENLEANIMCLLEISAVYLNEFWKIREQHKGLA